MNAQELKKVILEVLRERTEQNYDLSRLSSNKKDSKMHYQRLFEQQQLMKSVFNVGSVNESQASVLNDIQNSVWEEQNAKSFMDSLYSSKRVQFLSPYTEQEFSKMKLCKVKGEKIGFAIKSDGDVIAVHNNSSIGGLGAALMRAAIKNGGKKLDHFDGFLTGLYDANGFSKVVKKDLWNEEYAPSGWQYTPVDIFSPTNSAYAKIPEIQTLKQNPKQEKAMINNRFLSVGLVHAVQNYRDGRPSIIYREI